MKNINFILFATAIVLACNPSKDAKAQQSGSNSALNLVRLDVGGCRGYCPVYALHFLADGTLRYTGYRFVERVGEETVKLSDLELARLRAELTKVNLWGYPPEFPTTVADAPVHTITVYDNKNTHAVKGSAGIPKPVLELEKLMQDLAEAHGIYVKHGVDPNDPASMKGEVWVKFAPEVNAGNFCMQFMEFKVKPLRRMGEANEWMIAFSPSEITQSQFISILRSMEGVLEAQPK